MVDLEKFANILGADTVKKIYEDGVSQPVQETGKIATDFIKTARLFTAPIQLLASYQDRLSKYFEKVRSSVPKENQIEAPAFISGPIIDKLKYLEETNYLTDLYLNLLSRAIDKERINEAHPAFLHIIDQLSPDEAYFLFKLKDNDLGTTTTMDLDYEKNKFYNYQIIKNDLPVNEFTFPENFQMYYSHLESLNLLTWHIQNSEYPRNEKNIQIGIVNHGMLQTTEFGKLFIKACIPEKGFIFMK
ncbi:MAG TPA: DUF4393 domain-containing protein [Mucilaginibacter sp.]|jgi:hypothetical protein